MTTAEARAFDSAVRHRIDFGRYSSWMVRRVIAQTNQAEAKIVARLAATDPAGAAGARLEAELDAIRIIHADAWREIKARFTDDIAATAGAEAVYAEQLTLITASEAPATTMARPQPSQLIAAVLAAPFLGKLLSEVLDDTEAKQGQLIRETIRQGVTEGQGTADVIRRLRGTATAHYRDGELERSRRAVAGMVRTALTHTSVVAHEEVYGANADLVFGVRWISVLDTKTSPICFSRDGKVYPVRKGPRPPAHMGGCRSSTAPVLAGITGMTPFKAPTYPEWLSQQSAATQDDILGPKQGRLYRSGGLKVEAFVERKDAVLTLEQLRSRDAAAFAGAMQA